MAKIDLKEVDESELSAELRRRQDERERLAAEAREMYLKTLEETLFDDTLVGNSLRALLPEHGRTSCDDDSLQNGFGPGVSDGFRCQRCAILELFRAGVHLLQDHDLKLVLVLQ